MNPNNPYQQSNIPPQTPPPGAQPPYQGFQGVPPTTQGPNFSPMQNPWAGPSSQSPTGQPPQGQGFYGQPQPPLQMQPVQQPPSGPNQMPAPAPHQTPPPRVRSFGKAPLPVRIVEWFKKNWWAPALGIFLLIVVGDIVFQMVFPVNALPPGTVIDGAKLGGVDRAEAVKRLDEAYGKVKTEIFFGESTIPYAIPNARELGISVDNSKRLQNISYPLWLRFVPTSYMWASSLNQVGEPLYDYDKSTLDTYVLKQLGEDCTIKPQNATLKLEDDRFTVVKAVAGGKCNITDFKNAVSSAVVKDSKITIRTPINETKAVLTDDIAQQLADELNHNLSNDMPLQAGGKTNTVPSRTVKGWLSFKAVIPEVRSDGKPTPPPRLAMKVEKSRLRKYLDSSVASRVEKKPGVTKISTTDFTETSKTEGAPGILIDLDKTIASIESFIFQRSSNASVSTGPVPPTVQYSRKYTPTEAGFSALIEQFAFDNKGKIGIAYLEISGKKPHTSGFANERMSMKGSGIENAYLAYAAQAGIEDGSIQPTDKIAGSRNVSDCIKDAIAEQDSECAKALLDKVGQVKVQSRMQQLGLVNTSFSGENNVTSARDALTFVERLVDRKFAVKRGESLEAPMRNINLREGFIRGTTGTITSFGGESGSNYSEAGYISQKGRYLVAFISEGSDHKTAAKLLQQIDKLREEKSKTKGN
ncbi:hypothetical protein GX865_03925 [Candidatus Saccharibacteria bacterium]|nr:hypothetical protein [Candidatus Saccharibacteria bacterium]